MLRLLVAMVTSLALVALLLPGRAENKGQTAESKELERFSGTWQAISIVTDGKEAPREEVQRVKLFVNGPEYALRMGDESIEGTHKLDPTSTPKVIDAVRKSGPDKGKKLQGIYELTYDTYRACFAPAGKPRPSKFQSPPGSGYRLFSFERVKKDPK